MKRLRLLLPVASLVLATGLAHAQSAITLTPATFPAAPGAIERYQDANVPAGLATPPVGANQSWDYRLLTAAGLPYTVPYLAPPASGGIAGAQWTRARQATIGNLAYAYTAYDALSATGTQLLGRVVARQPYPLATVTGSPNDSVVINKQTAIYNGSTGVVNFPLPFTTGGYARRSFRFGVTGILTVAAAGLNKAPFRIIQRYQFVDSVAGWGTVRVPVAGQPGGSAAQRVLLLRSRTIRQDSVYLNGSPAPAALLALFGFTQGAVTASYYDGFWRAGSVQPVLELYYTSRLYTAPVGADYSAEGTLLATQASALASAGFVVWPNPAQARQAVQFALPAAPAGQPLALTVRDALGRAVAQGRAVPGQPTTLLRGLAPGLYSLEADTPTGRAVSRVAVE